MALVVVGKQQNPSQVAGQLVRLANRVKGASPQVDTTGPRMAFIVDDATADAWSKLASPDKPTPADKPSDQPKSSEPAKKATAKKPQVKGGDNA